MCGVPETAQVELRSGRVSAPAIRSSGNPLCRMRVNPLTGGPLTPIQSLDRHPSMTHLQGGSSYRSAEEEEEIQRGSYACSQTPPCPNALCGFSAFTAHQGRSTQWTGVSPRCPDTNA